MQLNNLKMDHSCSIDTKLPYYRDVEKLLSEINVGSYKNLSFIVEFSRWLIDKEIILIDSMLILLALVILNSPIIKAL